MECTGERFLPEFDRDWTLEHRHRYLLACEIVEGKRILDIACGDGYGSAMMAEKATRVVGVDIDVPTVERARQKYQAANLSFLPGSVTSIPLEDHSVDIVVSFETIEHLREQDAMMCEIRRVLVPDGVLLISSPDKLEYSDRPNYHNEYHVKELYFDEFRQLLAKYFSHSFFLGQKVIFGSVIAAPECSRFFSWNKGGTSVPAAGLPGAVYHIAVAGNAALPRLPGSVFQEPLEQSDTVVHLTHALETVRQDARRMQTEQNEARSAVEKELVKVRTELDAVRAALDTERAALTAARAEIAAVMQSKSWKLTAPLRALGNMWRK